jgi:mRNA interferase MazF
MKMAVSPERGQIWLVRFDPSVGDEIQKMRPAVVVSSSRLSRLRLRVVIPITGWQPRSDQIPWHYLLKANKMTRLDKDSAADALQIKSVSLDRFDRRLGQVSADDLEELASAVQFLLEG